MQKRQDPQILTTQGCIGFDTLNIPSTTKIVEKRISRKLKIMVSIITVCCPRVQTVHRRYRAVKLQVER